MASSSYNPYRRYSKSQMCFFKIIHIISSIPPSTTNNDNRFPFDLNLTFSSITQQDSESSTKTTTTTTTNNNNNNHEQEHEQEIKVVEEERNVDDVATEMENENDNKTITTSFPRGDCNCFDLLIEAARVLSEKSNESDSAEEKETETELMTPSHDREENEREPVVRSKSGRNRFLPCRFRDSVVEPLKRTGRNQRLSFTTNAKKRLLR
ncbi:hypothetical protein TSUD_98450 [Trifolium subterraneum]|uniref:Uncharacterized protein n=1 Tax=Trifolium subterraneum TaxID=3900 RepID=A0A2Z6PAW9_TRISU|nr:hypothetical protein TSUD_98450 [Trifolium subterraneum]